MLAVVLVIVLTIAASTAGLLQLTLSTTRRQAGGSDRKLAFYLAESGLAEAYAGLTIGKTGIVGTPELPVAYGQGLFWVEADVDPEGLVTLECTAMVGTGQARLALVAERGERSVSSLGFFSDGDLDVLPGALIDGYDSEEGTYKSQKNPDPSLPPPPATPARLGANGTISVTGTELEPTMVDGAATPGPQLSVVTSGPVDITGPTVPARSATTLPPVEMPGLEVLEGITLDGAVPFYMQPGEIGVQYITVGAGAELVLAGPSTIEVGQLRVEPTGALQFDTRGGAVDLYVADELVLADGASVSTSSLNTANVTVQVAGTPVDPVVLAAKGRFYGVVYAPEARVELSSGFKAFGAIVADELQIGAGARMHFDVALDRAARETALPQMLCWRIVELSNPSGLGISGDPFTFLGVDRATLPSPAEGHADQLLRVEYFDAGLVPQVYEGLESGFDWSQVASVTFASRDGVPVIEPKKVHKGIVQRSLEDAAMASADLKRVLKTNSPLTDAVLVEAVRRAPAMTSPDLLEVLDVNLPLSDYVLLKAVENGTLSSGDLTTLLVNSSPLSGKVLDSAKNRAVPLDVGDLASLLLAQ